VPNEVRAGANKKEKKKKELWAKKTTNGKRHTKRLKTQLGAESLDGTGNALLDVT